PPWLSAPNTHERMHRRYTTTWGLTRIEWLRSVVSPIEWCGGARFDVETHTTTPLDDSGSSIARRDATRWGERRSGGASDSVSGLRMTTGRVS
ncbi:hypothetical protein ACH0BA_12450, partial [Kocuria palustris]